MTEACRAAPPSPGLQQALLVALLWSGTGCCGWQAVCASQPSALCKPLT